MTKKYMLDEERIPRRWYNIVPDFPEPPAPPLHPGTMQPAGPDDLAPIFPMGLIMQEASTERYIDIPDEVREIYRIWRPTPLIRADRSREGARLPDNVRIFFKYEGVSPAGSHKSNTAVAQAYYNQRGRRHAHRHRDRRRPVGQRPRRWPARCSASTSPSTWSRSATSRSRTGACMMQLYGAEVYPSPTEHTAGRAQGPGRAIPTPAAASASPSPRRSRTSSRTPAPSTRWAACSTTCCCTRRSSAKRPSSRSRAADAYPDVVIGCVGGGSSFAGIAFPFMREKLAGKAKTRFVGVEPTACPSLTKGVFTYDFGDAAQMTPLLKMYTLGHDFMPAGIHAGGLRYHGMAPLISHAYHLGLMEAVAVPQTKVFEAAQLFAQTEGIVPAPESAHAIRVAIDEALAAKDAGEPKNILFNLTGHGYLDLGAYEPTSPASSRTTSIPKRPSRSSMEHVPTV